MIASQKYNLYLSTAYICLPLHSNILYWSGHAFALLNLYKKKSSLMAASWLFYSLSFIVLVISMHDIVKGLDPFTSSQQSLKNAAVINYWQKGVVDQ